MTITAAAMQAETAQGLRCHQAGDLSGAARLYRAALARDPDDADAACLLGLVHQALGRHDEALEWIGRAVEIRPGAAAYHASFALSLQALGRLPEAAEALAAALERAPDDPSAHVNRGVVLRALADREAALGHFRRAVSLAPGLAPARTNLAGLLLELGRPVEALEHALAAVTHAPMMADAHLQLGDVHLALGRPADAASSYHRALPLEEGGARASAGLGLSAARQGAWRGALAWFRRAVERESSSVTYLRYLAEAAGTLGLHDEVRASCARILAIDPDQAVAHNALGWVLQESGRHDEAEAHFRDAIRLQPEFATAHYNLGVLHEELGDLAEAEARYRSALRHDPSDATALSRLAALLRGDLPGADRESLRRRLDEPDLSTWDRANLEFALAIAEDGRGRYAEAAGCLSRANALALGNLEAQGLAYDPAEHRELVDRLVAVFSPALFERLSGAGLETRRPVFVLGLPRSGTTMIEQVLASHSDVHGAGEVALARQSFEELAEFGEPGDDPLSTLPRLGIPALRELARRHERRLLDLDGGRSLRVIGKMPDNYVYLGLIALMFPRAVVIHCRRDPRDVALSCWSTNFRDVRWANHEDHIASRFADYRRLMGHWDAVLPATFAVHEVAYEDAVADLEGVARRLIDALGLDWDPACLEFHRTRRPVRTASQVQVRRPVYRGSVGRWKLYRDELSTLFAKVHEPTGAPGPARG